MENKAIGSSLDDFLAEKGITEEVEAGAMKKIIAHQLQETISKKSEIGTNILLDTNTLYYVAGIEENIPKDIKITNIRQKILQEGAYISELSVVEFCTYFFKKIDKIKILLNKMNELNISIIDYPHYRNGTKHSKIFSVNLNEIKDNALELEKFIVTALEIRISIESQFLLFLGVNLATLYLGSRIYPDKESFPKDILEMFTVNTLNLNHWVMGEDKLLSFTLKKMLLSFYLDNKSVNLKNEISKYLISLCKLYLEMYHTSITGYDFVDFLNGELSAIEKQRIKKSIKSDTFYERLQKIKEGRKLISNILRENLEYNIEFYKISLSNNFNKIVIDYYVVLLNRMLTENKKLDKNNIIDSLLLNYYPEHLIITHDTYLLTHIRNFNLEYHNKILSWFKKAPDNYG